MAMGCTFFVLKADFSVVLLSTTIDCEYMRTFSMISDWIFKMQIFLYYKICMAYWYRFTEAYCAEASIKACLQFEIVHVRWLAAPVVFMISTGALGARHLNEFNTGPLFLFVRISNSWLSTYVATLWFGRGTPISGCVKWMPMNESISGFVHYVMNYTGYLVFQVSCIFCHKNSYIN